MLPYFTIFGKVIGSYAIMTMLGFVACTAVVTWLGKKQKITFEDILLMLLSVAGGIVVGGHILYGITHLDLIIHAFKNYAGFTNFLNQMMTAFGGMVFYGGFIGSVAAVYIHTHFSKAIDRKTALNLLAIATPLFHAFGRIGCFLGGCCYGIESSFGFIVHDNPLTPELNGVTRFPVQLVEAGCNLLIFALLFFVFRRKEKHLPLLATYIFLYAPVRFVMEFLRGDQIRGFLFGLSTSQWVSILLLIAAVIYVLVNRRREACHKP